MRLHPLALALIVLCAALPRPVLAVDPPYEPQMERLAEILGSLYFLNPLCKPGGADWREQMSDLVRLDQPDDDRQQRLYGAFNSGYSGLFAALPDLHAIGRGSAGAAADRCRRDVARQPRPLRRIAGSPRLSIRPEVMLTFWSGVPLPPHPAC